MKKEDVVMDNYEETQGYKLGLAYKKFGEALMDQKSTLKELVNLAFYAELDLSIQIGRSETPCSGRYWEPTDVWEEHPKHSRLDWSDEVASDSTRSSYIDWVNSQIEQEES